MLAEGLIYFSAGLKSTCDEINPCSGIRGIRQTPGSNAWLTGEFPSMKQRQGKKPKINENTEAS